MSNSSTSVANFYNGKSIFITGGSGSVGKILIEKLLRCCPGITSIYLLMRSKDECNASERLSKLLNIPLFSTIREECPQVLQKLVVVEGDINLPNKMGMSELHAELLLNEVSIVFHSAAVAKFDKTLRDILSYNLFSTQRLLHFCRKMQKLEAFVYVSTLYSMCHTESIGECLPVIPELDGVLDFNCNEDEFVRKIPSNLPKKWVTTYTFSKALTEILLTREKCGLPISIVRPSIIMSTMKEPMPGWIDNIYGPTSCLINAGVGLLRSAMCDVNKAGNLIPSDIVVNLLICVAWKTAKEKSDQVRIYNCCSVNRNPAQWKQVIEVYMKYSKTYPFKQIVRYPKMTCHTSRIVHSIHASLQHYLVAYIVLLITRESKMLRLHNILAKYSKVVSFFTCAQWTVDDSNVVLLANEINEEDKKKFFFDVEIINWNKYLWNYAMGTKIYLLKENIDNSETLLRQMNTLYWKEVLLQSFIWSLVITTVGYTLKLLFSK